MRKHIFRAAIGAVLIVAVCGAQPRRSRAARQAAPVKARVIVGATILDGSGGRAYRANLRIVGDTIAGIGLFAPRAGEEVIRARGLVVAPGFIDIHNHSEEGLTREPT